jgi:hypothetical protein
MKSLSKFLEKLTGKIDLSDKFISEARMKVNFIPLSRVKEITWEESNCRYQVWLENGGYYFEEDDVLASSWELLQAHCDRVR